ncbi:5-formyltetrahydrofolate cyclo-ligase [Sneathiella sp. HT1-7]|jgi:5,10-methenyltetrahydrofolate synthetase|uniref:5-formyltetrahydrofolate cyclo-ligase n=1 Tax=Sneathiella sp. HT1-7 TaxID=2887192 RepID=UPI001D136C52|nr:5-formyltetrahydrofolate cyclo-ligase [Sneathiella sp. HT1-7]MCC3306016.1 5-formyltetrahydrofolate cyclo-ligase [Sneathiella sp. HT1-7]
MVDNDDIKTGFASPPCYAHELELYDNGYMGIDTQAALDVARWRKAKREELIAARLKFSVKDRRALAEDITEELERIISPKAGMIISLYWPMKAEFDLRGQMKKWVEQGVRIALPVVTVKAQPMIFREWTPDAEMEPGIWQIPTPVNTDEVTPHVVIAPLVGFDKDCYRLGYGGGYFDRTLAALKPRPRVIGIGYPDSQLSSIFPQPYDIPMDMIVTGRGEVMSCEH